MNTTTKRLTLLLSLLAAALTFTSCVEEESFDNTPRGNFEALWRILDEHYCFFDYKQSTIGVDWDEVYARYAPRVHDRMTDHQLFEVLANMLGELRDGHVNLYTSWDIGREWSWQEDYPSNISDTLLRRYLGTDYRISAGMRYRILDDQVGYVRYSSFSGDIGVGNLDEMLMYMAPCRGLVIDIRDNGGGLLTTAEKLASCFVNQDTHVGYIRHKTGKGHDDFSEMSEQTLHPSHGLRWQKPVAVLTNRGVYSAANEFVKYMRHCPNAVIVGDHTGGGGGMPFSSQLPNGWSIRFSACPMYDVDGTVTEHGISPDVRVDLDAEDAARGLDTIIETARYMLSTSGQK